MSRRWTAALAVLGLLFVGGSALFLFESQTIGRACIGISVAGAFGWVALTHLFRSGEDPFAHVRRLRRPLIGGGVALIVAGWVVFFAVWDQLGLLLVVIGAAPLLVVLAGVKRDPLLSPLDGPPFGDTGQG